jgi:tetratricopeptide (TPR) repeat protein
MAALADTLLLEGEYGESLALAQWVIDHEPDMKLKTDAISTAACALDRMGRHERAEELIRTLPELGSDDLLIHILKGSARVRELRHKALVDGMASLTCLYLLTAAKDDDGRPALTPEERREALERLLGLYALFFPDGDYGFYAQFPAQIHRELAKMDAAAGKREDALTHLRECVRLGELFAACDPDAERNSVFFRGETDGGYVKSSPDYDYRQEIREWLADPLFDGLRERIPFEAE